MATMTNPDVKSRITNLLENVAKQQNASVERFRVEMENRLNDKNRLIRNIEEFKDIIEEDEQVVYKDKKEFLKTVNQMRLKIEEISAREPMHDWNYEFLQVNYGIEEYRILRRSNIEERIKERRLVRDSYLEAMKNE